ncbi:MAG: hypothetical protein LBN38_08775 [Verrucomicrobiota bacterium]|jgi:hypothetical protein|nr:hypothetical protein [Verrucomicrobiota bacterium]
MKKIGACVVAIGLVLSCHATIWAQQPVEPAVEGADVLSTVLEAPRSVQRLGEHARAPLEATEGVYVYRETIPLEEEAPPVMSKLELAHLVEPMDAAQEAAMLRNAELEDIQLLKQKNDERIEELTSAIPLLRRDLRNLTAYARTHADVAKETRKKINELEVRLAEALQELPEIKAKRTQVEQLEQNVVQAFQLRRELNRMISQQAAPLPAAE